MQIQFAIEGEMQLSRTLLGIAENVRDWTPAFEKSADDLIVIFSGSVFETEGASIDEQWSPLSRAYAARKAKQFPEKGILQRGGANSENMRDAFQSKFDSTSATIWNAASYFKYHQSNKPRNKLPRRIMMKLTSNMKEMVVKNFQQQFQESLGN